MSPTRLRQIGVVGLVIPQARRPVTISVAGRQARMSSWVRPVKASAPVLRAGLLRPAYGRATPPTEHGGVMSRASLAVALIIVSICSFPAVAGDSIVERWANRKIVATFASAKSSLALAADAIRGCL